MGSIEEAQWASNRRFNMSKATLTFNLPEEQEQFEAACKGQDLYFTLLDIDKWLRNQLKYVPYSLDKETLQEVRDELYRVMSTRSVDIDMMS